MIADDEPVLALEASEQGRFAALHVAGANPERLVGGVPFRTLGAAPPDGTLVSLPPLSCDWVHLLLDGARPLAAELTLFYAGGLDPAPLYVHGSGLASPRVGVPRHDDLIGLRLPALAGARLLALTVELSR